MCYNFVTKEIRSTIIVNIKEKTTELLTKLSKKAGCGKDNVKRLVKGFVPFALSAAILLISFSVFSGYTLAYEVDFEGQTVGYIADRSQLEDLLNTLDSKMLADDVTVSESTSCQAKYVSAGSISDVSSICDSIISVSSSFSEGVGLYIDGQLAAVCTDRAPLENLLTRIAENYTLTVDEQTVPFSNYIEYVDGLYKTDEITDDPDYVSVMCRLTYAVTSTEIETEYIMYDYQEVENSELPEGTYRIKSEGEMGEKQIEYIIYSENGVELSRTIYGESITKAPIAKIVEYGTKKAEEPAEVVVSNSAPVSDDLGNATFCWPLDNVSGVYISAYFGDGRNHQGMDICAPNGTAIYAGEAGTVVAVGYDSGWGKYVKIDHGNGLATLYAHCSSISAYEGQSVTRGQYIAAVGITGRATAYHLHFEVYVNGTRVSPTGYLGL